MTASTPLGVSGNITKAFIGSPLTPLFLLAALALGLVALFALPREEEPQISVPMVDIFVRAEGLKAEDAVRLVTEPLETIVKAINGVEHVYSNTIDDRVVVTARFLVGTRSDDAILRVHEKVRANMDRIPIGIPEPLIVGRGIDDVAIVTLTLAPRSEAAERYQDNALYHMAENLRVELAKLEDVGLTYLVGGRPDQIRVEPDPEKLSLYGITLQQLTAKVREANRSFFAGRIRDNNQSIAVAAGQTLQGIPDVGLLLISARDGRPVYVRDVASVVVGAKPLERRAWHFRKAADGSLERVPAVTVALAKRAGANAVVIAEHIIERLAELKGHLVPSDVDVVVTRNYGETANEKANELLYHLGLATISIVLLVGFAIGWREGLVVLIVIPVTILLTLFASYVMGYTINRVSLFALIFSIGILVDDAIVVIENIARHWAMGDGRSRAAGRDRGRRRGRQSDHRGHPHGRGSTVADAVRVRPDGPLHEPDSGQRLLGDDPVVLRRGDGDALADAAARTCDGRWRRHSGRARPRQRLARTRLHRRRQADPGIARHDPGVSSALSALPRCCRCRCSPSRG